MYLLYIYFSCWPAPKYSWTPPLVFPLKMSVISQTCSGWWLPKLSQQTKNIFKVGNVIKNIAVIDVVFMSLLWYLDILLGLRIQKQKHQSLLWKRFLKNLVKFTVKHLRRGLFFNKVPDCKPTISSNRYSGTGVFLWVFNKHTAAPEEQDLLVESLFIMLQVFTKNEQASVLTWRNCAIYVRI